MIKKIGAMNETDKCEIVRKGGSIVVKINGETVTKSRDILITAADSGDLVSLTVRSVEERLANLEAQVMRERE